MLFVYFKLLFALALIVAAVWAAEETNEQDVEAAEGYLRAYGGYGGGFYGRLV